MTIRTIGSQTRAAVYVHRCCHVAVAHEFLLDADRRAGFVQKLSVRVPEDALMQLSEEYLSLWRNHLDGMVAVRHGYQCGGLIAGRVWSRLRSG
jgi:hypothetical protein